METTPCPGCGARIPVTGDEGSCAACGMAVRFVDAPKRPCDACGKAVPLPPERPWVACPHCGAPNATDPRRGVRLVTPCPRCRRRLPTDKEHEGGTCPHCGTAYRFADTL